MVELTDEQKEFRGAFAAEIADTVIQKATAARKKSTGPTPQEMYAGGGYHSGAGPSVKVGQKSYSHTKSVGKHVRTQAAVCNERGQDACLPSQYENAKAGAFLKHLAARCGIPVELTSHDRELMDKSFEEDTWAGLVGGRDDEEISGTRAKSILDDTQSGGLEISPIAFDSNIITFPLLSGELFPFVDLRDVPRGRRIEGASVGNPTVTWGINEGAEMPLFNTDSLIAPIDSTVYNVVCAVTVGRDLLSDSPADMGRILTENVGNALALELDKVIALGNGTTQPTGITVSSGLGTVNAANGGTGPPTLGDYEALLFGIAKQYRTPSNRCCYISNDVSYRRSRQLKVDPAATSTDERRLMGMNHESYETLGHRHCIQNSIGNRLCAFGNLSRYRMYRRLGMSMEWFREGQSLALRNEVLLVARGRFAGRVVDGSAFTLLSDGQS